VHHTEGPTAPPLAAVSIPSFTDRPARPSSFAYAASGVGLLRDSVSPFPSLLTQLRARGHGSSEMPVNRFLVGILRAPFVSSPV